MNLKITGLHLDITDAIRARVTEKLQRINRHSDNILSATVTLSVDKLEHKAAAQSALGRQGYLCGNRGKRHVCRHRYAGGQIGPYAFAA